MDASQIHANELVQQPSGIELRRVGLLGAVARLGQGLRRFDLVSAQHLQRTFDLRIAFSNAVLVEVEQCQGLGQREHVLGLIVAHPGRANRLRALATPEIAYARQDVGVALTGNDGAHRRA